MFLNLHQRLSLPHRIIAVLGVALVLVLSVLAVRPDLHEALCHHHSGSSQGAVATDNEGLGCVVSHFAAGHLLAALCLLLLVVGAVRVGVFLIRERLLAIVCGSYRLPPGRGPPNA